jgi:aspartate aminotransferase-like enzyme
MSHLVPNVDPDGLLEYSVVYTDRALNHMSQSFQGVMRGISTTLKKTYNADTAVIVPGSGTFGMEAVARQFAQDKHCLIIRNGWFSFRWTQILEMGKIASSSTVMKARPVSTQSQSPFIPAPIEELVQTIEKEQPEVVFAPHVETSCGMILPEDYLKKVAQAVHSYGGVFVLDCIASGTIWIDMKAVGIDVLVTAPQKGWSGPPCAGLVMLSERATKIMEKTVSSSFSCDLLKWLQIMRAYENNGHAYHATMPTDALTKFYQVINEVEEFGFEKCRENQYELGTKIRQVLENKGIKSVAEEGFKSPGVVVSYTTDDGFHSGKKFSELGLQIAAGVPLQCDEPADFKTFRIGLFGLDKLKDVDGAVQRFSEALNKLI